MKHVWKSLVALVLCAALLCPAVAMADSPVYGMATADNLAVRKQSSTNANIWFYIDWGFVCEILDVLDLNDGIWYKVESAHPEDNGHTYTGYVHGDYFRPLTVDETNDYLISIGQEPQFPGSEAEAESQAAAEEEELPAMRPSAGATLLDGYFDVGIMTGTTSVPTATPYVAPEMEEDGYAGSVDYTEEEPDYSDIIGPEVEGATGVVTSNNVHFRAEPTSESVSLGKFNIGAELKLLTMPPKSGLEYWFKVEFNGIDGYVCSKFVSVVNAGTTPVPSAEPTDELEPDDDYTAEEEDYTDIIGPATSGATGRVTTHNVNFRAKPTTESVSLGKLPAGTEVELLSMPPSRSSEYWFKVRYNGVDGYVCASYIRVLEAGVTASPSPTLTVVPTATPVVTAVPTPTIDPAIGGEVQDATGMITADGVNFRLTPSTDGEKIGKLNSGTVVELLTIPNHVGAAYWYKVRYNGQEGYVQSNYIRVLSNGAVPSPAPSRYGYAKLDCEVGNLRDRPGGVTMAQWRGIGTMLQIVGPAERANGYNWYPVYYGADGNIYYVREDIIMVVDDSGSEVTPEPPATSPYGYVITTEAGVNLRLKPNGEMVAQIARNVVLRCVGVPVAPQDSVYTWYYVEYNGMRGYLRGDCVRVCDANGNAIVNPTATPEPTATPVPGSMGYIRMTHNKVNIRQTPGGTSLGLLQQNLILPIVGETLSVGNYKWYCVRTPDGIVGYVRGDMLIECDENGVKTTPTPVPTATPGSSGGDSGNSGSTGGSGNYPTLSTYGYVRVRASSANVRDLPGTANASVAVVEQGSTWPMIGRELAYGGYIWYPIKVGTVTGFIRNDVAFKLSPAQEQAYLAGLVVPTDPPAESTQPPAPDSVMSDFVIVTGNKVNLRVAPSLDSAVIFEVEKGTVMPYDGTTMVGTQEWYAVVYEGRELYIRGDYVRVMTQSEYNEWLGTSDETVPTVLGYVKFIKNNVNVRNAANGSEVLACLKIGTVVPYYREGVDGGNTRDWYLIKTPEGVMGYVREDMVKKCNENGGDLPSEPGDNTPDSSGPQEATYTTLKLGSTGDAVVKLVTELKRQGYYTGAVTSYYDSSVRTAVMAFQAANGLTVDGIAGSATQHKLFGTVPVGSGTNNLSFEFYPVEKIDWFSGGIQQMWPKGANFKVYDVKTGIVWWAHRWSGAYHADIEPLTAADTARLCKIYGVNNAQEIADNNLWHRRPSLVTIGSRTFACSLDGMPHNPAGDTIPDNDMTGQICLHFTNSKGHESGAVSTSHTKAIQEAYDWAKERYGAR